MKKLRILKIVFEPEIKKYQIPGFRGAVVEKVGRESTLFHNHLQHGFRYRYPLIQYKRIKGKASIICIDQGVDEIYHFFQNKDWRVKIYDEEIELKIGNLSVNQFNMQVWNNFFYYRINTWLALNEKNQTEYEKLESLTDKIAFLENILTANILSFAKGIDWHIEDKKIEVKIINITDQGLAKFKRIIRPFFSVEFKTNVFLPNYIGLGKAASHGYGVVSTKKIAKTV